MALRVAIASTQSRLFKSFNPANRAVRSALLVFVLVGVANAGGCGSDDEGAPHGVSGASGSAGSGGTGGGDASQAGSAGTMSGSSGTSGRSGNGGTDGGDGSAGQPDATPDGGSLRFSLGPTFPLTSDATPDPRASDSNVAAAAGGGLSLLSHTDPIGFLWFANDPDYGRGSVSKIDTATVKEVARYASVTCFSNAGGSRQACDGTSGCCARDDRTDFLYRQSHSGASSGVHQAVQQTANSPGTTVVDLDGDAWVYNRAFNGGQASVTKIAGALSRCVDRNGVAGVQTSRDVNGDGLIETDCNQNGLADDVADVAGTACSSGRVQEFFGLDDDCILLTTNVGAADQWGRALALAQGVSASAPSDVWVGTYNDGWFYRLDSATGLTNTAIQLPSGAHPFSAVVDRAGILWANNVGAGIYYFDTQNPTSAGTVRAPSTGDASAFKSSIDPDQNVWFGGLIGNAVRYSPNRSAGFAELGQGRYTIFTNPTLPAGSIGRVVAVDARSPYFAWMTTDSGRLIRIPAASTPLPTGADQVVDGTVFPSVQGLGNVDPTSVDPNGNLWTGSINPGIVTRVTVDASGNLTPPNLSTIGSGCPASGGDRCLLDQGSAGGRISGALETGSELGGFGYRRFVRQVRDALRYEGLGSYSYVVRGCATTTRWISATFQATIPAGTAITQRARSGPTTVPDSTWSAWSTPTADFTIDLAGLTNEYLQIEMGLSTNDLNATPNLTLVEIVYACA